MKLPKQIYVVRTQDGEESFLTVHEDWDSIEDGDTVGIYELKESRRMILTRQWET